jgi:hypothetical protein
MKKYRETCKGLHMVFIDLEKTYDKFPREVLEKKGVILKDFKLIKDIYDRVEISVRTNGGITSEFPLIIGLNHGLVLSLFLFAFVMDEITKSIQEEVTWCILFANNIVSG